MLIRGCAILSHSFMSHQHSVLSRLLSANAQWAADVNQSEPGFFQQCALGQSPKVLWIGCADSRVPESVITACKPGDIFVHRNIANQFHLDDDNALSVLAYAVDILGVEHVVVVGHTQCGGAAACFEATQAASDSITPPLAVPSAARDAPINRWLAPLISLASSLSHNPAAEALPILVEENVKAQVKNLCNSDTVLSAWAVANGRRSKPLWVHGWVYEIENGTLKDLGISKGPPAEVLQAE